MQEDYEEASRLKLSIKERELVVNRITSLKQQKELAVQNENFEEAMRLKAQISQLMQNDLRLTFGKQPDIESTERFGGTGEMMSTGKYLSPLQGKFELHSQPKSASPEDVRAFNSQLNIDEQIIPTLRRDNNSNSGQNEEQASPTPKTDGPITQ